MGVKGYCPVAMGSLQMPHEVTLDDVERAAAAVRAVKSELAEITSEINSLALHALFPRVKRCYLSAVRATRLFFETQSDWKPVVAVNGVLPLPHYISLSGCPHRGGLGRIHPRQGAGLETIAVV